MGPMSRRIAIQFARSLRKNMTNAEKILWAELRKRRTQGKKFLRQHPIFFSDVGRERFYIADFYCHEQRLVIELDGRVHENQKEQDEARTYVINQLGIKVIRFTNDEVENNLMEVMRKIDEELLTHPRPFPSPKGRE